MNVIRHNHIPTYCHVVGLLGALGKKNERSVDLILCQEPLSFVCAERDEIKRTCCEDPSQTWWSPSESPLHWKSYSTSNKTVAAVATALRVVIQSLVGPAAGRWLQEITPVVQLSVRSLALKAHQACQHCPNS